MNVSSSMYMSKVNFCQSAQDRMVVLWGKGKDGLGGESWWG